MQGHIYIAKNEILQKGFSIKLSAMKWTFKCIMTKRKHKNQNQRKMNGAWFICKTAQNSSDFPSYHNPHDFLEHNLWGSVT